MKQRLKPLVSDDSRYYRFVRKSENEMILYTVGRTGYLEMQPGYYLERQNYNSYCLSVTVSGNGQLSYEGKTYRISKGNVAFFNQNENHVLCNVSKSNWCHYYVYFWGSQANEFYTLFHDKFGTVASGIDTEFLIEKLIEIQEEVRKPAADAASMSLKIYEIMIYLYRHCATKQSDASIQPAIQAESFLREHYKETIKLDNLAADANVSKYYLAHVYKKVWGFSPMRHLIEIRFEKALALIRNTDLSIRQILEETNFANYHMFIEMCKARTGVTPSTLRQRERNN